MTRGRSFPKSQVRFELNEDNEERGIITFDDGSEANLPKAVFAEDGAHFIVRSRRALSKLRKQEVPARKNGSNRGKVTKRLTRRR